MCLLCLVVLLVGYDISVLFNFYIVIFFYFVCCRLSFYCGFVSFLFLFFFVKQKTAYEMRMSDWSSDVCSSDLTVRPDSIQFHGSETPEWIAAVKQRLPIEAWKAIGLKDAGTLDRMQKYRGIADRILFDAPAQALPGGTGTRFDWSLLKNHRHTMDWGIAGGLDPSNVAAAIAATGAPLVDVSTGVESAPSVKDVDKMAAFLKAAGR